MKNKITLLLLFLSFFLNGIANAQDGTNDPSFNPSDTGYANGANGTIYNAVPQLDGKIVIAGNFNRYTTIDRSKIARINADETLDLSFNPGEGANNTIRSVAIQQDGKIIIGGYFTEYDGQSVNRIARLNTDGSLDASFATGEGLDDGVTSLAIQPDGKILVGGIFEFFDGQYASHMTRLNNDGTKDSTFSVIGVNENIFDIAVQPDGKILAVGTFTTFNFNQKKYLVRLNANGTTDSSFIADMPSGNELYSVKVNELGIYIGGSFVLKRLNQDGTLNADLGLSTGLNATIYSIALQSDGKILATGDAGWLANGTYLRTCLARVNIDGTLDESFTSPLERDDNSIYFVTLKGDGKILACGDFYYYGNEAENHIVCLNSDGTKDSVFDIGKGTGADYFIKASVLQPDGKIVIAGGFLNFNGVSRKRIARLNQDGTLDETFSVGSGFKGFNGGSTQVSCLALQPDGKLIVIGNFKSYNGQPNSGIIRLNSDGTQDDSFNVTIENGNNFNTYVALQPDGKILYGGYFIGVGSDRYPLCRLNHDGSVDTSFNVVNLKKSIGKIIVQPDNKILVALRNAFGSNASPNFLVRLNSDGTTDLTFTPVPDTYIDSFYDMVLQSDGKIYVSGWKYDSGFIHKVTRLNNDGTTDTSFNTPIIDYSPYIAVQGDGKVVLANIYSYNNTDVKGLIRINTDGSLDETFNCGSGVYGYSYIESILFQDMEKMIIAGWFSEYYGEGRNKIARINSSGLLGNDTFVKPDNGLVVYKVNNSLVIDSTRNIASVDVYDLTGRLISQKKNIMDINTSIDGILVANTILIVNVKHVDGTLTTKKIYF